MLLQQGMLAGAKIGIAAPSLQIPPIFTVFLSTYKDLQLISEFHEICPPSVKPLHMHILHLTD